jgi:hypothetical protein
MILKIQLLILNPRLHDTKDTTVADQLKTKGRWNAIIARKWLTQPRTVDFEPLVFSRENSKTDYMSLMQPLLKIHWMLTMRL